MSKTSEESLFFLVYHSFFTLSFFGIPCIYFFLDGDVGIHARNVQTQDAPKDPKHSAGICGNFRQSFSSVDASESSAW